MPKGPRARPTALARRARATRRDCDERDDGTFDIPAEPTDDGHTRGERGQGSLDEVAISGWRGHRLIRSYESLGLDGQVYSHLAAIRARMSTSNVTLLMEIYLPGDTAPDVLVELLDDRLRELFTALE